MRNRVLGTLCGVAVLIAGCAHAPEAARAVSDDATWETLPSMPIGVIAAAGSISERQLIITGGIGPGGVGSGVVQVLDLDQLTWITPAMLATPRYQHAQATPGEGVVLVIGGQAVTTPGRGRALASCERVAVASGAVTPAAALPQPIATPTAHRLADGRIVAAGGRIAAIYDPAADTWTSPIALHRPRREHMAVLLDERRLLVIGGTGEASLEVVDLARSTSRLHENALPFPLDDGALVALPDGRVWLLGGQDTRTGDTTDRTWLIDLTGPGGVTVTDGPRLPIAAGVSDQRLVALGAGYVMVGGESQAAGRDTELTAAFWLEPATLSVRVLAAMPVAHDDAVAAADGAGVVVVGGGLTHTLGGRVRVVWPTPAAHRLGAIRRAALAH